MSVFTFQISRFYHNFNNFQTDDKFTTPTAKQIPEKQSLARLELKCCIFLGLMNGTHGLYGNEGLTKGISEQKFKANEQKVVH